jgi:hypothetical protein
MAGEVTFTRGEADYIAAQRDYWAASLRQRKVMIRWGVIVLIAALFTGATFGWGESLPAQLLWAAGGALYAIVLLGIVVLITHLVLPRRARHIYRQTHGHDRSTTVSWTDQGYSEEMEQGSARLDWRQFHCWCAARSAVLLYHNDLMYRYVPHIALTEAERVDLVDTIARSGLARR